MQDKFYNCDCIEGAKTYIKNDSVDLIICDPPYGIKGDTLDKHYNRNEAYVEVAEEEYPEFSEQWLNVIKINYFNFNMHIINSQIFDYRLMSLDNL